MDNQAYLDQIAVKSKKVNSNPVLTPTLMKLLIVGFVALILILVVIVLFSNSNSQRIQKFASIYQRSLSLSNDESPLITFSDRIKSSDLRQYNSMLQTTLQSFNNTYASLASTAGFDPENISEKIIEEDASNTAVLQGELDTGFLNGVLDETYASSALYQISVLMSMNQEALSVATNTDVANTISNFNNDLTELQKLYKSFSN